MDFESRAEKLVEKMWPHTTKLLIIPILILVFSLGVIGYNYSTTGQVLEKGLEFSGGTEITVSTNADTATLENVFNTRNVRTISENQDTTLYSVEVKEEHDSDDVATLLQENNIQYGELSVRSFGSTVSQSFFLEAVLAIAAAFLIMSIVVFVAFREWVPSVAVILAAATDILFAVAMMIVLHIELAFGSLAALLMLIGYSVDTDIMLSTRILKSIKGDIKENVASAIVTGTTMSLSAVTAFLILFFVSTSPILDQIAAVIIWGLLIDIVVTYTGNAIILKWYVEKR